MFCVSRKSLLFFPIHRKFPHHDISIGLSWKRFYIAGNRFCPNQLRGLDHLRDPRLNKGLAFTLEERIALGIHGLLPPQFKVQAEQLEKCKVSFNRYKDDMSKYIYLMELQERSEKLFYTLLNDDIQKYLPIVYTPTVGMACQTFGLNFRRPRGIFISINDKGKVADVIRNWPEQDVRAIVFTDGERILGLGDLGAYGMGIPIGKLVLYTALAGIQPHQCLPITLDVGTDNEKLLEDPLYIGTRQIRVRGKEYDEFIDEFLRACTWRFGTTVLLQFEDFGIGNAIRLLEKYKSSYCTFNDDVQGTAGVALAGLIAACRVTKRKLSDNIILFLGAGSAAIGIGNLTIEAMKAEGTPEEDAVGRIYMFDIDGLLTERRKSGISEISKRFAKDLEPDTNFLNVVKNIKATCLIGCSTKGGAFTPEILKELAQNVDRPVIFALSNPTVNAECTAQEAYDNTEGRCVFASGSPFPPVNYNGKKYETGQGNNSYIFPGVALGIITSACHTIPDYIFLKAAQSLANLVSDKDLELGRIYPSLTEIKNVSLKIAVEIVNLAYEKGIATVHPRPKDIESFIKSHLYDINYSSFSPNFYKYPPPAGDFKVKPIHEAYKPSPQNAKYILNGQTSECYGLLNAEK